MIRKGWDKTFFFYLKIRRIKKIMRIALELACSLILRWVRYSVIRVIGLTIYCTVRLYHPKKAKKKYISLKRNFSRAIFISYILERCTYEQRGIQDIRNPCLFSLLEHKWRVQFILFCEHRNFNSSKKRERSILETVEKNYQIGINSMTTKTGLTATLVLFQFFPFFHSRISLLG